MKVLFVLECSALMTNGTTASCLRFANELNKKGHKVTVIGCELKGKARPIENYVEFKNYKVIIFDGLIHKEGFQFVKVENDKLNNLIKENDVIHFFLPFKLANNARLIAEAYNKPVTGAFHLQPDSITSAIHMNNRFLNWCIYKGFYTYMYKRIDFIHCPSKMIADKLKEYKYDNQLRIISNGISSFWHRVEAKKNPNYNNKFVVSMVGRLADEKRQDLLIKAVKQSKHEKDIQLVLCGQGPNKHKLEKLCNKLKFTNKPIFEFLSQEQLREFLSSIDLYVHCSDAEIEGLSCVEAFTCGVVPVISDSKLSASSNFALCDESLFKHGNYKDLATKIDYWFEHEKERLEYSKKYIELSKEYALELQVTKFEKFLSDAIEYKKTNKAKPFNRRKDIKKQRRIFKKLLKAKKIDALPASIK